MKKISLAITVIAALSLTACGASQGAPQDDSVAAGEQNEEQASDPFGTYEVEDEYGAVYTLDLSKPFDYSNDLIERSNEVMRKAINATEGEGSDELTEDQAAEVFQWTSLIIDNTNGTEEASASLVDLVVVGDDMQYDLITEAADFYDEMTNDYITSDSIPDEEYDAAVDIFGEWVDSDLNVKPGAKITVPVIVSDMPESIDAVWYDSMEMDLSS